MQGLCHISELSSGWLAKAEDVRKCHEFVSFAYLPPILFK
jgi:predicted RNA-binding protein with RPS1 domain